MLPLDDGLVIQCRQRAGDPGQRQVAAGPGRGGRHQFHDAFGRGHRESGQPPRPHGPSPLRIRLAQHRRPIPGRPESLGLCGRAGGNVLPQARGVDANREAVEQMLGDPAHLGATATGDPVVRRPPAHPHSGSLQMHHVRPDRGDRRAGARQAEQGEVGHHDHAGRPVGAHQRPVLQPEAVGLTRPRADPRPQIVVGGRGPQHADRGRAPDQAGEPPHHRHYEVRVQVEQKDPGEAPVERGTGQRRGDPLADVHR